jgi:hypothetical protein
MDDIPLHDLILLHYIFIIKKRTVLAQKFNYLIILVFVSIWFQMEHVYKVIKTTNLSNFGVKIKEKYSNATAIYSHHTEIEEDTMNTEGSHHLNTTGNASTFPKIDRIYYINLDNRTDKRNFMESWLNKTSRRRSIPYQRVPAKSGDDVCKKFDGNPGHMKKCRSKVGLRKSNLDIMDNYNTTGYTLVLEDDVQIKQFNRILRGIRKVPDDWDVIRFGCWRGLDSMFLDPLEEFPQFKGGFRTVTPRGKKKFCGGTHVMVWRSDRLQNLRKLWEHPKNTFMDIDCALADDDIKSYCVQTKIGRVGGFKTDIPKRRK